MNKNKNVAKSRRIEITSYLSSQNVESKPVLSKQETSRFLSDDSHQANRKINSTVLGFLIQWSNELSRIVVAMRSQSEHHQTLGIMSGLDSLDTTSISQSPSVFPLTENHGSILKPKASRFHSRMFPASFLVLYSLLNMNWQADIWEKPLITKFTLSKAINVKCGVQSKLKIVLEAEKTVAEDK